MWSSSAAPRHVNYGLSPEFFFVAPAEAASASAATLSFDPNAIGVGVIPLLTAAPCPTTEEALNTNSSNPRGRNFLWHQQQQGQGHSSGYLKKPTNLEPSNLLQTNCSPGIGCSSAAATCQDCGNQAKKDCPHRRCRTCCKSRGYDCATHVKSTWVPAARRRERQLMAGSSQSTSGSKKPKLVGGGGGGASQTTTTASHTSTSNTTPPRSFDTSSSHQDKEAALPGQVRAPAVFKCVRVTALDDGEDEYAYQALVKIGGHVFKGFLYDQGLESRLPNISELYLGGGESRNNPTPSSAPPPPQNPPVLDPSDMYAAPGACLLGGSSFSNPIN